VNGTYCIKSGTDFAEFNKINLTLLSPEAIEAATSEVKEKLYKNKYLLDVETIKVTKEFEPNPIIQKHVTEYLSKFEEKMKQVQFLFKMFMFIIFIAYSPLY